jgi:hypothetical protein
MAIKVRINDVLNKLFSRLRDEMKILCQSLQTIA